MEGFDETLTPDVVYGRLLDTMAKCQDDINSALRNGIIYPEMFELSAESQRLFAQFLRTVRDYEGDEGLSRVTQMKVVFTRS